MRRNAFRMLRGSEARVHLNQQAATKPLHAREQKNGMKPEILAMLDIKTSVGSLQRASGGSLQRAFEILAAQRPEASSMQYQKLRGLAAARPPCPVP